MYNPVQSREWLHSKAVNFEVNVGAICVCHVYIHVIPNKIHVIWTDSSENFNAMQNNPKSREPYLFLPSLAGLPDYLLP